MSRQVIECSHCKATFKVDASKAGRSVKCPSCAGKVKVPEGAVAENPRPSQSSARDKKATRAFACPNCQQKFGISPGMLGKTVGCPHCRSPVKITPPAPSGPERSNPIKPQRRKPENASEAKTTPRSESQSDLDSLSDSKTADSKSRWTTRGPQSSASSQTAAQQSVPQKSSPQQSSSQQSSPDPKTAAVPKQSPAAKVQQADKHPGQPNPPLESGSKGRRKKKKSKTVKSPTKATTIVKGNSDDSKQSPPSNQGTAQQPEGSTVAEKPVLDVAELADSPTGGEVEPLSLEPLTPIDLFDPLNESSHVSESRPGYLVRSNPASLDSASSDSASSDSASLDLGATQSTPQLSPLDGQELEPVAAVASSPNLAWESNGPVSITHLLPPRFDALDPDLLRMQQDPIQILLPDGKGGVAPIDPNVVRIEHGGEQVALRALTHQQKSRRRLIQNMIAIALGIISMAIVFSLLVK